MMASGLEKQLEVLPGSSVGWRLIPTCLFSCQHGEEYYCSDIGSFSPRLFSRASLLCHAPGEEYKIEKAILEEKYSFCR